MSTEEVNNVPVVRITKHALDQVVASPSKSFSVTLEGDTYKLTVQKLGRKET